ncbi:MAG: NAD(P)/FAD-dependent oxidoreductase [Flavobacteriaceae bacterium]|nr:NAD(P)/FAD-dependent oxidoreductase [Flavobacteriaceae bacterium]
MKLKEKYDVVVVGSGLGGLICAIILAKEGKRVCVLEKNNQYGGNLQTFSRNKTIFDTGVHYIGGLSPGQNLYKYFNYLGILDELEFKKLDEDGFDIITFDNDPIEYNHAQGYSNFIRVLVEQFPEEEKAISNYCKMLKDTCSRFPLYNIDLGESYYSDTKIFQLSAKKYIESLTSNKKLQAVLGGTNLLYAGDSDRTPFYVHALSVNSYIESAYRCVNGGSQITKALLKKLREAGGETYKRHEVVKLKIEDGLAVSAITKNGKEVKASVFISNVDPKLTLTLVGKENFRKSYVTRIETIESSKAAFSLYLVFKPKTFKYYNKNFYHFKNDDQVWDVANYKVEDWPSVYMVSMGVKKNPDGYANHLTAMTYMDFDEVAPWEDTFNTVAEKGERGQTYEEFKREKEQRFIDELEKKFPNIRDCIEAVYSSTPLSYRDYIGSERGSMYGYVKDINAPLRSFISAKSKIKNLFFTGQSLNMHGILGVTISGVATCSEIIGNEYLVRKIQQANTPSVSK